MANIGGWIGVDLDGTIAEYDSWVSETHIGKPVPLMVARVKQWLEEGRQVKIFTARMCREDDPDLASEVLPIREAIEKWCKKHIGVVLPITHKKDYSMLELWDDRCVQVIPNTGRRVDGADALELEI